MSAFAITATLPRQSESTLPTGKGFNRVFRRAITVCAAFFALFALACVVHAADPTTPTFIPPRAGTDIPVILSLAKHSACKDAARDIERQASNVKYQIQNLKSQISNGLFPWRFEVTNGYQEGFFYHALQGYALEQSGDIPAAYRAYQNSRLYINEDVAWATPDAELEVYLGIGRTCMKAGRWTDALDYTETARINGAANSNIAVNADRLLIERARSIGDYKEAIELYKDLEILALLTRDEYKNYAQILFWSHRDREGFSKLLEGICKLSIDNNLGVKDPMVDVFLNNIMRADDDEVKYFYDLLGWAIVDARARAGDEEYLAFLCNARTLFCKVYDFLEPEDDLEKVKRRIDVVKKQLAEGYDVFGSEKVSGVRFQVSGKKKRKSKTALFSESGELESLPETYLDDLLMTADCKMTSKDYQGAKMFYQAALESATGALANLEYDGTTTKNAAAIGTTRCGLSMLSLTTNSQVKTAINHRLSAIDYILDRSMRAAQVILQLYELATNDTQRAQYDTKAAMKSLPRVHPMVISYLSEEIRRFFKLSGFDEAMRFCNAMEKRCGFVSCDVYVQWGAVLAGRDQRDPAFSQWLHGLSRTMNYIERKKLRDICARCTGWGDSDDLLQYPRIVAGSMLARTLTHWPIGAQDLRDAIEWRQKQGRAERLIRSALRNGNVQYITNAGTQVGLTGHSYDVAGVLLEYGMTNEAVRRYITAMNNRMSIASLAGPNAFVFPSPESLAIDVLMPSLRTNVLRRYVMWLAVNKSPGGKSGHTTRDKIGQCLRNIIIQYPYATNFPCPFLREL